jgi:transposase
VLHPHPEVVQDPLFAQHAFFDSRDRVQVKYEMLRRHRIDERPVSEVAQRFGVSRQSFYTAHAHFESEGLPGLLPRPRGPRRAHKCTDAILDFVEAWRAGEDVRAGEGVNDAVRRRFGLRIHPRSIDRALARRRKKHRAPPPPA